MSLESPKVLIMGIGNILLLDEGVGGRIAVELERNYTFPADVRIMDAGTMGLGMIHLFRGVEFLLVADAIDGTGHPPGTVLRLSPEAFAANQVLHSLHDVRFVDVLGAARMIDIAPEADCVGVQIKDMRPAELTIGLSDPVERAVPRAVAAVLYILQERGIVPEPATGPDADPSFQDAVAREKDDIAARQESTT